MGGKGTARQKAVKGNQNTFDDLEQEGKKKQWYKCTVCCFLIQKGIGLPLLELVVCHGDYTFI